MSYYSKHQATNGVGWLLQDQEQKVLWLTALVLPQARKKTSTQAIKDQDIKVERRQSTCHWRTHICEGSRCVIYAVERQGPKQRHILS